MELMTCSFLSQSEFATFLSEFKEDDSPIAIHQSFVNLLERTSELFSRELINIAKLMLVVDPKSRCSLKQLLEIHEISNYLSTPGPLSAEHQEPEKTQHRSCKTYDEDPDVNAVIAEMKSHVESPLQLVQGMWKLNRLIGTPSRFDEDAKTLIGHLMRKHKRNADFNIAACTFLANLARQSAEEDLQFIRSLISAVSESMKCFPECYKLQIAGAIIFKYVSMNKDAAAEIGAIGGVQDNISALKNFPDSIEVCTACCSALSMLSLHPPNAKTASDEDGLRIVMATLEKHIDNAAVAEAACAALWTLSVDQSIAEKLKDQCPVYLITRCLLKHSLDSNVVGKAMWALAGLVESDESSAYEVLYGDFETSGMSTLINAHKHHQRNQHISEGFAKCVAELSKYEDLRTEINNTNVQSILCEEKLKFDTKSSIQLQIDEALVAMGNRDKQTSARDR